MLILDREESAVFAIKTHFKYKYTFQKNKITFVYISLLRFYSKTG